MKQKIDTEIYAEKTIATYETKYRDNPLSKPQEIILTITSGHLYGKAFVCEQVATKEEDIFYSKFSASISDISNITINTYIKEYPIYISFEKPSKDNKYAKDRKRIILPSFENPENIVAQITETKDKLKHIKKTKSGSSEESYIEDYTEKPLKKSGFDDVIDIWDNVSPESEENVTFVEETEVTREVIDEQIGSSVLESEVNYSEDEDEFIEEEGDIRTPPIAPAPPVFETEEETAEEVLFETVRTATRSEKPVYETTEPEALYSETLSDDEDYEPDIEDYEEPEVPVPHEEPIAREEPITREVPVAREEPITREVPVKPEAAAPIETPGAKLSSLESFEESMKKLKIMYESGVIDIDEFNIEKKKILKTLY
ncbi:MAG: hypothetical protein LBL98_05755 [Ruminococcus sp.]|nr:hypothetical protein [Ruminococcus sp.]